MFIDIHAHTRLNPGPMRKGISDYASPEYLIKRYNLLGIEASVILPGVNPECATHVQSNEEVMDIVEFFPGRFIPFCNIDPRMDTNDGDADLGFYAEYYKSQGYKGCGEVCANLPFDDPRVEALFLACEKHELSLTFHIGPRIGGCYGLYDEPGLPLLEKALQKFPGLRFLGHSQPFWAEISTLPTVESREGYPAGPVTPGRVVELMRKYPNLCGDMSAHSGYNAVSRDESFGVEFMDEFQDRLYFGTDICHLDTPTPLVGHLLRLKEGRKISDACFAKIARENAVKLLGL